MLWWANCTQMLHLTIVKVFIFYILSFQVYTTDYVSKKLTVMGYTTLNLFVEKGTERQPSIDKQGIQLSLNEGCHQLRLYSRMVSLQKQPLTEGSFREAGVRSIPCASLLVRLVKIAKDYSGQAMFVSKVRILFGVCQFFCSVLYLCKFRSR